MRVGFMDYRRAYTRKFINKRVGPARTVNFKLDAYCCVERYGYAWVTLEDPLTDIPEIPEADDPTFRRIPQFYEEWRCAGLRLMENSFDAAHQPFVHRNSFGDINQPQPFDWNIVEHDWGFHAVSQSQLVNSDISTKELRIDAATKTPIRHKAW